MDGRGRVGDGGRVLTQALPGAQPPSGSPETAGITSYLFKITSPSGYLGRNRPKALKLNSTEGLFHIIYSGQLLGLLCSVQGGHRASKYELMCVTCNLALKTLVDYMT